MKAVYNILNNQDKVTMKHFYDIRCDPDLDKLLCAMQRIPCACNGFFEQLSNPWLPNLDKNLQPCYAIQPEICEYSSILRGYNKWYIAKIELGKKSTNPYNMDIKDKLVLGGITWEAADKIEYNIIGEFQTIDRNMPEYYIVRWKGNAYNLKEQYTCHTFNPPVMIPEGKLVFPAKFMTPMRKTPYWYPNPDKAIPVMVKLKQVVMPYI